MRTHCRTCCRPVDKPYRVFDAHGHVIAGCVDADHDNHLTQLTESIRWHNRQESKKIRAASAKQFPRVK